MRKHHIESIRNVTDYFRSQPDVLALLLGGSLAHGWARPTSDVDVLILITEAAFKERQRTGQLHFFDRGLCTYPEGYVDGKYLRPAFLRQVAEMGSEPARFAFQDCQVLFSRVAHLDETIEAIVRYPTAGRPERLRRFHAQFEAWNWYTGEALKQGNPYLLEVATSKLALFGGRLILAHNELLYPYHKWFLKMLERAQDRPRGFLRRIHQLCDEPSAQTAGAFYSAVKGFREWPALAAGWPVQFMQDSELSWLTGNIPVDDL